MRHMGTKHQTSALDGKKMGEHTSRGYDPGLTVNSQHTKSGHEHHITTGRCDEQAEPTKLSHNGPSSGIYVK
jgi:hypothetical protein